MKLKMVKFVHNVDVRGNFDSGCNAREGVDLTRAPNGDVIITMGAAGGQPPKQIIVGHSNVSFCEPFNPIAIEPPPPKAEAKK